jgi:ABC-2 type transport system ATP-binding protein
MSEPIEQQDQPVLVLEEVAKAFAGAGRRVQALEAVSLAIYPGRITGLIGPDGAGKTTLMRLVAGVLIPDTGRIAVLGLDVVRDALKVQATIGYMPQRFGLYEDLSVQENLDLYADLQGLPITERRQRYATLLQMTALAPFTRRLAGQLSGGMKQKLGLACTLVRPPRLLLLDEPTVGVDPVSRRELWAIVDRLVRETSMSVLLSTAYLNEAEHCAAVVMLYQGKVLGQGAPKRFSDALAGRTYAVTAKGLKRRQLQARLSHACGVVDAVVQGDAVRLVMASTSSFPTPELFPSVPDISLVSVPSRFEDWFVAELRSRRHRDDAPDPNAAEVTGGRDAVPADPQPVIQVHNVQRRFGNFYAVKGISFTVNRGEVFGLLGANGAGKSTTFRMLCGLLPSSAGTLHVTGLDLRYAAASARGRIGYMSQKFSLYGNLSVLQNLKFFSSVYGLTENRRRNRMAWALKEFALEPLATAPSGNLPQGFQQRLALACALLHEPEVLFLDEPTSGVDPLARRGFWRRINALAEAGVTVLVTTHFMEEAEYCDRLAIMEAGEILILGTPLAIKQQVRTAQLPNPTIEDAFITLTEGRQTAGAAP